MEDYQLPPWSNDYHFNINVQMIYTPALATNRLANFKPLWRMINGWMPQLKKNGEAFFGRPGALMLPHAVDDMIVDALGILSVAFAARLPVAFEDVAGVVGKRPPDLGRGRANGRKHRRTHTNEKPGKPGAPLTHGAPFA